MPAEIKTTDEICAVMDDAIAAIADLRRQNASLKAANEGWKRAFSDLHDALEKIAGGYHSAADMAAIALGALHTEEAA